MGYIQRDAESEFLELGREFPIVLVTGVHQAGKSTMLERYLDAGRKRVTLDDFEQRALAREDPELFLQAHKPPVMIDEVQYAPELFPYLKIYADKHPNRCGDVWLTGSQPFKLMKLAGDSLAGRVGIIHLLPLSQHEAATQEPLPKLDLTFDGLRARAAAREPVALPNLYQRIWDGSMPAVVSGRHPNPARFYRSYQQTFIERDVRELDNAADMVEFARFMAAVAAHTSQLLNIDSLARDVGIPRRKAEKWLGILEGLDIIFLLRPYSNNALSRVIKTPKLYFNDTGLVAWLGRWSAPETLEAGAMSCAVFENFVVSEIRKALVNSADPGGIWFYRDRDAKEVDLVLERSGLRVAQGVVFCMKRDVGLLPGGSIYAPVWAI